jgi:L-glutamine-phosphate cytidylyltransferase
MKLIILGAGRGKRLGEYSPKILVKFGRQTLFEILLGIVRELNFFSEVIVVTGYQKGKVVELIKKKSISGVTLICNPFYNTTGPLVSLWFASSKIKEEDFVVINGDSLFSPSVFRELMIADKEIIRLLISKKKKYEPDDMKVKIDKSGCLLKIHKNLQKRDADGESAGVLLVKGRKSRKVFMGNLNFLISSEEYLKPERYWHELLNLLIEKGVLIKTKEVKGNEWKEIDTKEDFEKAQIIYGQFRRNI